MRKPLLGAGMLLALASSARAFTFAPTTSLSTETAVNTSAPAGWTGWYNGKFTGDAAAANVSREPVTQLVTGGVKVYAEMQSWFCKTGNKDPLCKGGHITIGYDSADPAQIQAQVNDQMARGISGMITDWYGTSQLATEVLDNLMPIAQGTGGKFQFSVMIDKGYFNCADGPTCTSQAIAGINTVLSRWSKSSAYMTDSSGKPLIFWFMNKYDISKDGVTPIITLVDWNSVVAQINGSPRLIFIGKEGLTDAQTGGAYGWVSTTDGNNGFENMSDFYSHALGYPNESIWGGPYKGFNDNLASWSKNRVDPQYCGRTWLDTYALANASFTAKGGKFAGLMIATWDDYEEGTESETGIDNCLNDIAVSMQGSVVNWSPVFGSDYYDPKVTGTERTIHHYLVHLALHGQTALMPVQTLSCVNGVCPHSFDLGSLGVSGGPYDVYVQAIGQPFMRNRMSISSAYYAPSGGTGSVTLTSPVAGATFTATIPVIGSATANAGNTITTMQIYLDDVLVYHQAGNSVNYDLPASSGSRGVLLQAWDDKGLFYKSPKVFVNVLAAPVLSSIALSPAASTITAGGAQQFAATAKDQYGNVMNGVSFAFISNNTAVATVNGSGLATGLSAGSAGIYASSGAVKSPTSILYVNASVGVVMSSPTAGSSYAGAVPVVGSATPPAGKTIVALQVYVDDVLAYQVNNQSSINTTLPAAAGARKFVVQAWDSGGAFYKSPALYVTVTGGGGLSTIPGLRDAFAFPDPAIGADPTIRACLGMVDSLELTVFDLSGRTVYGAQASGSSPQTINGEYCYDLPWTRPKASGLYFFVVHGKASDGTVVRARGRFAVVR